MSYSMRFILTDGPAPTLDEIERDVRKKDTDYSIDREPGSATGDVRYEGDVYGEIEVGEVGAATVDQDLADLASLLPDADDGDPATVEAILKSATSMVKVRFPSEDQASEQSLQTVYPIWQGLFATRQGVLQADDDGYFDKSGRILGFPQ